MNLKLMALATMAAVVAMSILVTKNQSGFGEYVPYKTIVKDASGIFPKTPIKVAGISAGRIKSIELADNNALITFEVLKKISIPKNSKLRIKTVGFLGDKYLEIVIGDSTEELEENSFISSNEGAGLENLIKDAGTVLKDVKVIVASMKESLAPEGEEPPMKQILADVKDSTAALKRIVTSNEEKLNELIENMNNFSKDIAYQMDEDEKGSSMEKIKAILGNADKMMGDLQKLVADVKAGKGTVGKLLVEEDIADEVQQTLAGVKKLVGKVDQIRTELALFTE